ncbi:MAG: DUF4248 domain-containing protein [Phocaeicola sp.]|uniref:DUF4248 domain-containing protein n=1 Tax=Phocaeicola TaxID=909656 RepID=UPI00234E5F73|nr:DUF4248 domain-containing protein [Phocaeicola oris]MCE2615589.1 DUF4248 domain-containing protein [Phocaeicola oris]
MEKQTVRAAVRKSEMALRYNPESPVNSALKILRRWILYNKELHAEMLKAGYSTAQRSFTPKQVSILYKYLGEP